MNEEINLRNVVEELKAVKKILIFSNSHQLELALTKYAKTNEQKMIWILIDGKHKADDIARQIGKAIRTVEQFLKLLEQADLIERGYGMAPVKLLDYVPPDWLSIQNKKSKAVKKN